MQFGPQAIDWVVFYDFFLLLRDNRCTKHLLSIISWKIQNLFILFSFISTSLGAWTKSAGQRFHLHTCKCREMIRTRIPGYSWRRSSSSLNPAISTSTFTCRSFLATPSSPLRHQTGENLQSYLLSLRMKCFR